MRCAIAEAIGTFFLVLVCAGAAMVDGRTGGALGTVGVALASGFVVMAMIYALGHLSGAHINPAVTIAFWSVRRFPGRAVPLYVAAQCGGAVAAAATLRAVLEPVGELGTTVPALAMPRAFVVEGLLSFALMFVIAAVATDSRVADGFAGLAVGLVVAFDVLLGAALTGASMNPARSFGPALSAGVWESHWLYWLAPIGAMIAAAWIYEGLRTAHAPARERRGRPFGVQGPLEETSQ